MTKASFRRISGRISVVEVSGFGYDRPWRTKTWLSTIDEFAHRMGYHRHVVVSPQGRLVPTSELSDLRGMWASGIYTSFEVYDSDGVHIPAHIILEDVAAFRRDAARDYQERCWRRRGWPLPPEAYFRNGPLPGSRRRLRRPKDYKRIGTFSEVRRMAADITDMKDEGFAFPLRWKRSGSMIGDNDWDGVWSMRAKDRSWKRHRRKQWR